jgi:adenosine deaminase
MDTATFIQKLPKAEFHLHLEGAVDWSLAQACAPDLPETPHWWHADYRFPDFTDFENAMRAMFHPVLTSPERFHQVAQMVFDTLAQQNVRYVEVSFSADPPRYADILPEIVQAIHEAAPATMIVKVIGALNRRRPIAPGRDALADRLLAIPGLDGCDIHGDERTGKPSPFAEFFQAAHQRWQIVKAHAGEICGADSVRETLDTLRVNRIEHGTRSLEDRALMQRLIDEQITLDMCPTSNVRLRVVDSYAAHPIADWLRRGLRVTVNTDDPTLFNCTLTGELHALVTHLGMTHAELAQLQKNGFAAAVIPDAMRQSLFAEIDALLES